MAELLVVLFPSPRTLASAAPRLEQDGASRERATRTGVGPRGVARGWQDWSALFGRRDLSALAGRVVVSYAVVQVRSKFQCQHYSETPLVPTNIGESRR